MSRPILSRWIPPAFSGVCLGWLLLTTFSLSAFADEPEREFRAGAATSNITPPLGELIVGGWKPIPARTIHDELHARCLVLDNGLTRIALVLCDNVGIPEEVFQQAQVQIQESTGIPASHVLLASTHTHSATTARGPSKMVRSESLTDYQRFLAGRISDAVRRAIENLRPARIAWGSIDEPSEVFNRRWFVHNAALLTNPFGGVDRVRMNPPRGHESLDRPAGPTDPEISFLSLQDLDGRPIALLANYSLHYVGGVRSGDVSADYFGYFAKAIERKLGASDQSPPFVGILSNGTSGDVNNINFREKSPKRYEPYAKMQEVAQKVADKVYQAHEQLQFLDWVPMDAARTGLTLSVRKPTEEMTDYFSRVLAENADSETPVHSRTSIYAERIEALKQAPDQVTVPLQALRIGDWGIAAIPFETFAETGLELKDRSPFERTMVIELANGSFGYLPTPGQHRLGGYETWLGTNYVQPDASERIVSRLLELFSMLQSSR
ncbi:hypothetical protein FYK55_12195 [Roseiconus nitratireducens]|uniref:Neutral/alkaline non-lysosomal ceramidase N-terminal domain-containing protein n=1 Tax=Roseiconus nitratireducens TaxID=2605748 RepID=A0A5M6DAM5_9BACT|nr:neutral/alkaline non-lysosomal ceramidase N-terminal domain-containing protein [Roseiconus nitratireducens]KAA5543049.1 hypothetical protein FYK55_12195 [Roseiconus nitratireducens]